MTPTRELLEAALHGFDIQRKAIEAKQAEIREALKSPIEVMAQIPLAQYREPWRKKLTTLMDDGSTAVTDVTRYLSDIREKPKRKMSAAGRAAISKATKARWAKYRKEQKHA